MKSAQVAEWLLRRTPTWERAAAEVGDLLELKPLKGSAWVLECYFYSSFQA